MEAHTRNVSRPADMLSLPLHPLCSLCCVSHTPYTHTLTGVCGVWSRGVVVTMCARHHVACKTPPPHTHTHTHTQVNHTSAVLCCVCCVWGCVLCVARCRACYSQAYMPCYMSSLFSWQRRAVQCSKMQDGCLLLLVIRHKAICCAVCLVFSCDNRWFPLQ
jgi:hypothetical protein